MALQKKSLHASEQNRPDVKARREEWKATQNDLDLSRLVFLDESGAKTNMTRLRGRAKGGQRCVDDAPHGHWHTTTMISSIRLDGGTACMAIDGATSAEVFREYVRQVLVRTLRPGDLVVLDNLSAHKDRQAIQLIESIGAVLVELIFRRALECRRRFGQACRWHGRWIFRIDGSTVSMPDTPSLAEEFGYASGAHGPSRFPIARLTFIELAGLNVIWN